MTPADTCWAPRAGGPGRRAEKEEARSQDKPPVSRCTAVARQASQSPGDPPQPPRGADSPDPPRLLGHTWPLACSSGGPCGRAAPPQSSPAAALCPPTTSGPRRTRLRGSEGVRPDRGPETCPQHTCSPLIAPTAQRPGGLRPNLFWMQGTPHPSLHQPGAHDPSQKSRGTGPRAGARVPLHGNHSCPEEPGDLGPQDRLLVSFPPSRARGQADPGASTSVPLPRWGTGPAGSWHDQDRSPAPRRLGPAPKR